MEGLKWPNTAEVGGMSLARRGLVFEELLSAAVVVGPGVVMAPKVNNVGVTGWLSLGSSLCVSERFQRGRGW